jgi:hypothetical protein
MSLFVSDNDLRVFANNITETLVKVSRVQFVLGVNDKTCIMGVLKLRVKYDLGANEHRKIPLVTENWRIM